MTAVLDHGEVILVDSMADDQRVTMAARISTGKTRLHFGPVEPDPEQEQKNIKLINYLMSNGHGTPFEHAVFQFYIKCPIFVAREWQRHRIASYNEFSMRYAEVGTEVNEAEFYIPDHVREEDPKNKQGSIRVEGTKKELRYALAQINENNKGSYARYRTLLARGVAREMARMVLPVNVYTKFWFTVNARSLMNFLMLRNADAAQWEIRQYAIALEALFAEQMPVTYAAFLVNGRRAP